MVNRLAPRSVRPAHRPTTNRQPTMAADQPGAKQRQPGPAPGLVHCRQQHLGAPLLVEPRLSGDRVRPAVDARDRRARQDLGAGAELVGEVDRRQAGDERGDDGQGDGEERPESGRLIARMLAPARCQDAPGR